MCIENQQFLDAAGGHALCDFRPQPDHRFCRQRQGSGISLVFRAVTDSLHGQEQHLEIGRQMGQAGRDHAFSQRRIDLQG